MNSFFDLSFVLGSSNSTTFPNRCDTEVVGFSYATLMRVVQKRAVQSQMGNADALDAHCFFSNHPTHCRQHIMEISSFHQLLFLDLFLPP